MLELNIYLNDQIIEDISSTTYDEELINKYDLLR